MMNVMMRLNSSFWAVTADSKSRWPHGIKAYFRGVGWTAPTSWGDLSSLGDAEKRKLSTILSGRLSPKAGLFTMCSDVWNNSGLKKKKPNKQTHPLGYTGESGDKPHPPLSAQSSSRSSAVSWESSSQITTWYSIIGHYQNEWAPGSESATQRHLGSFGGTLQENQNSTLCFLTACLKEGRRVPTWTSAEVCTAIPGQKLCGTAGLLRTRSFVDKKGN